MTIVILFDRIRCSDGGRGEDRQRLPDKMGDVSSHRRFYERTFIIDIPSASRRWSRFVGQ